MRTCDNIIITLNPPDLARDVHTNGDKIIGEVRLTGSHTLEIDRIVIDFKGKTKSRVVTGSGDNRRVHIAKGLLFNFRTEFILPIVPAPNSSRWPFEFQLPWESQNTRQPGPFGSHEDFEHEPGFALPPTFNSNEKGPGQAIYYYLEVIAHDRHATIFSEKKARLYVNFAPSRPSLTPPTNGLSEKTRSLSRCTKKLDPELMAREKELTLSQKTRRLFSTEEPKPISHFSIWSKVPNQGIVGGTFPIYLGVTHDKTRSTAPQVPEVTLSNINVRFTAHTFGRVPYKTFREPGLRHNHYVARSDKIYFLNRSCSIPMYERMDLGDHFANMIIPKGVAPEFRTYNISRRYDLKATADVVCVGETYQITMSRENGRSFFSLAPMLCRPRLNISPERNEIEEQQRVAEGVRATERSLPVNDEDIEWLPTYEETEHHGPTIEPS